MREVNLTNLQENRFRDKRLANVVISVCKTDTLVDRQLTNAILESIMCIDEDEKLAVAC